MKKGDKTDDSFSGYSSVFDVTGFLDEPEGDNMTTDSNP